MDAADRRIWFVGDLGDPWVDAIPSSLPHARALFRLHCPGDLPERPFPRDQPPRLIVLHRHRLSVLDAQRLRTWRLPGGASVPPAAILCASPYLRFAELERASQLVDLVISEATAAEVLARHVARLIGQPARPIVRCDDPALEIEVAGANLELLSTVVEACVAAGYRAQVGADLETGEPGRSTLTRHPIVRRVLTVWELPVLEAGWTKRLERRSSRTGPVIVLAGFADRSIVALARASGAVACLDLPVDLDDLLDVVARIVRSHPRRSWPVPPRLEPPHELPPPPRRNAARRGQPAPSQPWSDSETPPKIPT
jgi:hypothetical protein